jgi:Zn-finger nucleic acid-binding protein
MLGFCEGCKGVWDGPVEKVMVQMRSHSCADVKAKKTAEPVDRERMLEEIRQAGANTRKAKRRVV